MNAAFELFLLVFGAVGFAGSGAGLAVSRLRSDEDGCMDPGMLGVVALLFVFGTLCIVIGSGWTGVLAFGSVSCWSGYVVAAQRVGLFEIETGRLEGSLERKPRQRT